MEKRKKNLIAISVVMVTIIIGVTIGLTVGMGTGAKTFDGFSGAKQLTSKEVREDVQDLVKTMEATHPKFLLNTIDKAKYESAKITFLAINEGMSAFDFSLAAAKYVAALDDLHTRSDIYFSATDYIYDMNVTFTLDSTKNMFVVLKDEENFIPVGAVLVEIGGKKIQEITSLLQAYFATETGFFDSAYSLRYPKMLELGGLKTSANEMEFSFDLDGRLYSRNFKAIPISEWQMEQGQNQPPINPTKNFSAEKKGEELWITITSCGDDGSFKACQNAIKNSISNGVKKVVIDIRDNPGGDDGFCMQLLTDLGFSYSSMGFDYRYSWQTRRYKNTVGMTGMKSSPFKYVSENKNEIDLKILMNENTGSAAMTMVSLVRYSNIGEIIGRPSVQSPNYCGNPIRMQLKNSKVIYNLPVSYCYYENDGKLADKVLSPDVIVPFGAKYSDYIIFA